MFSGNERHGGGGLVNKDKSSVRGQVGEHTTNHNTSQHRVAKIKVKWMNRSGWNKELWMISTLTPVYLSPVLYL